MFRFAHILLMASAGMLTACQTVESLSIDYMLPAEVSFPDALRRVAVVNNAPLLAEDQKLYEQTDSTRSFWGHADIATESLAQALADGNYFDEVVICDSLLRSTDSIPHSRPLSMEEVSRLTEQLDVDFIISLEAVAVKYSGKAHFIPELQAYEGTIDAEAFNTTRVYLPGRQSAMVTLQMRDSIFWSEFSPSERDLSHLLPKEEEIIRQASDFAGSLPASRLMPHWKSSQRYLFGGSSVALRDAAVCAKEGDWDAAIHLWSEEYKQSKSKRKMAAAYNLAVGHEMLDRIDEAKRWIDQALSLTQAGTTERMLFTLYRQELEQRQSGMQKLLMQTRRLSEETTPSEE